MTEPPAADDTKPSHEAVGHDQALPQDPSTGRALPPRAQPGYFPGFATLSQQAFWDEATRRVVVDRVEKVAPIRFFTDDEVVIVRAIYDRIMPQSDRDEDHRIPVVQAIDERLFLNHSDGYRFERMPSDGEAHRLGIRAIERIAQEVYGAAFSALSPLTQDHILESIRDGAPEGPEDAWERLPLEHYWSLLVQDGVAAYYAHPFAWDEIGFGGPAYPRGYLRLEDGKAEPWEVDERRYEWLAPPQSASDGYRPLKTATGDRTRPGEEE